MKETNITLRGHLDYMSARVAAEQKVGKKGQPVMVAWYDHERRSGGPAEPCRDEPEKCVEDYARTHGAEIKVTVNNGQYLFYFAPTPSDASTLDRDQAIELHRDLPPDYDNIQGG